MQGLFKRITTGPVAAIAWLFTIKGFLLGNWIARIPAVTEQLDVERGEFGTILLLGAIGALISFQLAGPIIARWGSAYACRWLGVGYILASVAFVSAPNVPVFVIALFCFGFFNGSLDVSINAQGVEVERRVKRPILSLLHACFSGGSLIGTAIGAAFAALDIATLSQMLLTGTFALVVLILATPVLVPDAAYDRKANPTPRLAIPSRIILPLAIITFVCAMVEEAMADWAAIYLDEDLGTSAGLAAIGYTLMACTMLLGRSIGDGVNQKLGATRVMQGGVALAALGLGTGIAINTPWSMLLACACIGLGFSTVLPVIYRTVGTMPGIQPGQALASVATTFYLAFLVGPLVMGWIADLASLRAAFAFTTVIMCSIIYLAPQVRRLQTASAG